MVSVFVKAAIIVILVFIANFYVVKGIEDGRQSEITQKLGEIERESQLSRLLLLYIQQEGGDVASVCPALETQSKDLIKKNNDLSNQIESFRSANLISSMSEAKEKYILQSAELWLYLKQLETLCGKKEIASILYFYPEKAACPECDAQAGYLNALRDKCGNVRVFAFPYNRKLGIIEAMTTKYKITKVPSLVIEGKTYEGIINGEKLSNLISCSK